MNFEDFEDEIMRGINNNIGEEEMDRLQMHRVEQIALQMRRMYDTMVEQGFSDERAWQMTLCFYTGVGVD